MDLPEAVSKSAVELAQRIKANAILVLTETGTSFDLVNRYKPKIPIIAATANEETFQQLVKKSMLGTLDVEFLDVKKGEGAEKSSAIKLLTRRASKVAQIEDAISIAINKGLFKGGDSVVVVGSSLDREADSIFVYEIKKDKLDFTLYDFIRELDMKQEVFESILNIALEIGREGRGGRLIGTAFLIGDSKKVVERSEQLILNPFEGQVIGERLVTSPGINETIKELAQLDGAFVISRDGIIQTAGTYLNVDTSSVSIPRGLGSRHAAVAAITAETDAVGITVSQSGGIVRIFKGGKIIMTIEPQRRIAFRTKDLAKG